MITLFLLVFGSESARVQNSDFVKTLDRFNLSQCATYSVDEDEDFFLKGVPSDFSVYLPKNYQFEQPVAPETKCLVITNGEEGRRYFFHVLFNQGLDVEEWMLKGSNGRLSDFFGLASPDGKTFVASGPYLALFSDLPQQSQYEDCMAGKLYYLRLSQQGEKCLELALFFGDIAKSAYTDEHLGYLKRTQTLEDSSGKLRYIPEYLERVGSWCPFTKLKETGSTSATSSIQGCSSTGSEDQSRFKTMMLNPQFTCNAVLLANILNNACNIGHGENKELARVFGVTPQELSELKKPVYYKLYNKSPIVVRVWDWFVKTNLQEITRITGASEHSLCDAIQV